jgi:hypothetical protein
MSNSSVTVSLLREVRLRPQWAAQYPGVPVGVWLPASRLASEVRRADDDKGGSGRLPDDAFEFRGGRPELVYRPRARTRWSDHPQPFTRHRWLRPA